MDILNIIIYTIIGFITLGILIGTIGLIFAIFDWIAKIKSVRRLITIAIIILSIVTLSYYLGKYIITGTI